MKLVAALLLTSAVTLMAADNDGRMTDAERAYLVDQLEHPRS